jgi:hypothetical protein
VRIVVLTMLVACAPLVTPAPETVPIAIKVENVLSDQVSIYVVGRGSRRLGEVEGLSSVTLYIKGSDIRPDGTYRLVARRQFRGPFASSEELTLARGASIHLLVQGQGIFASSR